MTGVQPHRKNVHSVSHLKGTYIRIDRITKHQNSDEYKLINYAYQEELDPASKDVINDNLKIIMQTLRGVGWGGALELQYKLGRYLNEHPGIVEWIGDGDE